MLGRNDLRQAFDKVDKDNSGAIDLSELEALCGQLNHTVKHDEVTALFKEIDTNHDGKISFEEFVAWFRLGNATKLKGFLKQSLKGMAFVQEHKSKMTHEATGESERLNLFNLEVSEGQPGDATRFDFEMSTSNPELMTRVANACPSYAGNEDKRTWFVNTFKAKNPQALKEALETFLQFAKDTVSEQPGMDAIVDAQAYEVGVDGDYVVLAVDLMSNPMGEAQLEMAHDVAGGLPLESFALRALWSIRTDCSLKKLMTTDNLWDHSDNSGVTVNVSCDKSARDFAAMMMEQMPEEQIGDNKSDGLSLLKAYNGMSLVARANGANENGAGSAYKNTHNALKAFNQGMSGDGGLAIFEEISGKYKTYAEGLQYMRDTWAQQGDMQDMVQQFKVPAAQDLLFAFRDHGLYDATHAVVFNNLSVSVHNKGEGMAELFNDIWGIVYPDNSC